MKKYLDTSLSAEERAESLLKEMTLEEKLGQMFTEGNQKNIEKILETGEYPQENVGGFFVQNATPDEINRIHEMAKKTRLGIPPIMVFESLHGLLKKNSTIFPQSIGLGAAFNTELVAQMADVIGKEAYISGIRQTYAPDLDTIRELRWGRVEETYGEDPYLISRYGVEYVKNLQKHKVSATLKHYVAHGAPESGLNLAPVHMGEREVREVMLEPFETVIKEANPLSCMPAYSELDGIPVHASRFLLTDILRDELGFEGYTITDYGATDMLNMMHHVAKDGKEAAKLAINAGVDMEAPNRFAYNNNFIEEIKNGNVDEKLVDLATKRILTVKFKLGLFEEPLALPERVGEMHTDESISLARKIARECMVLLKNDGILPLKDGIKAALIGPSSDFAQIGDYSLAPVPEFCVSVKSALENRLGKDNVYWENGCHFAKDIDGGIQKAVAAASKSDVIIAVMGDNSSYFGGIGWGNEKTDSAVTSGEGFDVSSLELPPAQQKLFCELAETGKPIVFLLMSGRPYCIGNICEKSNAVMATFYPGEQGGNAICDILFGDECPSGKLPISFPRSTGHIPCYYNHKTSARGFYHKPGSYEKPGRDYVFDVPDALFEFGYGLSYTDFEYSDITVDKKGDYNYEITVDVTNKGDRDAKESVLLFVKHHYCPVTPFVKRLRKFDKKEIKKGETKRFVFTLTDEDFIYIDEKMKKAKGTGTFSILIGDKEAKIEI